MAQLTYESLTQRIKSDPNTAKIAKELDIPLEQYVAQVAYFVLHPDADPDVVYVEDQDLKKMGHTPPSEAEMFKYLKEAVAVSDATGATGFDAAKKKKVSLDGGSGKAAAPKGDAKLKADLKKQMGRARKG